MEESWYVVVLLTQDLVLDDRVDQQDLGRWKPLALFHAWQQPLTHDRPQAVGQRRSDEAVLAAIEELQDAGEAELSIRAVERPQHEVPRLGRLDGGEHRFAVAHLADQ